jgi:alkylation response protein AidB-like acyl-CoA dehydrogenase
VRDYGIEQTVRDSRIAMIYEGTNEIQAVDLVQRKAWLQISHAAQSDAAGNPPARWTEPANAVHHWVLPEFAMRLHIITARIEGGA